MKRRPLYKLQDIDYHTYSANLNFFLLQYPWHPLNLNLTVWNPEHTNWGLVQSVGRAKWLKWSSQKALPSAFGCNACHGTEPWFLVASFFYIPFLQREKGHCLWMQQYPFSPLAFQKSFHHIGGLLTGLLCPFLHLVDIKYFFRPSCQRRAYAMPEAFGGV